jgi:CBS-domain-containing membrane protein
MPEAQADAVVVDSDGHAVGLLARERTASATLVDLAGALMQPAVVALLEDAPLACAHELLLRRGVRTLPIVSGGQVVGRVEGPTSSRKTPRR